MLPEYELRKDVLAWNIKAQEPELKEYDDEQLDKALCCLLIRPKSKFSKRDRNFKIFVLRYQYRLPFGTIGKVYGITTERVRQLVFYELQALKKLLRGE
jgi:DNA-directed RNA polymerase specialized sigma subunit